MEKIRWGILAPGRIAHKFATGLRGLPDAELVAVGSRSEERARSFAREYGAERAYGSYEELAADPDVDVIYVATPHNYHREATILCLEHGKAVLCEKPIAVAAGEAQLMADAARANDVFLMEAMWTRFLPAWQQIKRWIDSGEIGELRMINGTFGFRSGWDPQGRLLNPELAGGSILDVGVYLTSAAYWLSGRRPGRVVSQVHIGETGVDEQAGFVFGYEDGLIATFASGIRTSTQHTMMIYGTDAWIEVPHMFWNTTKAVLHQGDDEILFAEPHISNGYEYQAREVGACLREGLRESAILPLDESVQIMKTLDTIRSQSGLVYPFESEQ